MFDTHAHLSMLARRGIDPHETLRGLFAEGFAGIIDISLEPGDIFPRIQEFSRYNKVRFASGLWPHASNIADRERLVRELEQNIRSVRNGNQGSVEGVVTTVVSEICALGEFGLDRNWNKEGEADLPGERELMEMQMDVAKRLALPVIIHSRDAAKETAEILARHPGVRGVVHCFSYSPEEAKTFLDLGYYISFAGNITYKNAQLIMDTCKLIPADRLLLETDCPYLAPVHDRGKPSHPGMVQECYKKAAEIRKVSIETLAGQIAENVTELFGQD
jgi:TatD DNase family protein